MSWLPGASASRSHRWRCLRVVAVFNDPEGNRITLNRSKEKS